MTIPAQPVSDSPPPRVVIIGAGMSGLLMGIKLLKAGNSNFRIYEKADRVGGTWRENTYPNVACDVFAPGYAYTFEPNAEWNWRFGRGEEIQRYFEGCARRYGLTPFIKFGCGVEKAVWQDDRWKIATTSGDADWADVLISAVGALHHPRYPDIPGRDSFGGVSFHTARWNHDLSIFHKSVGIIGTGSTAAQILPGIVDKADKVTLFQRTAQWVLAFPDRKYSESHKARRRRHRWLARLNHWIDLRFFHWVFTSAVRGNWLTLWFLTRQVTANLNSIRDPDLRRTMTPPYPPACKRLIIAQDFYPAIQKDNVSIESTAISAILPEGVKLNDGRVILLDVLVFATGFYPYRSSVAVIGEGGVTLAERMEGSPLTYRGIAIPGLPNYFTLFGPYTPIGNNSIVENSEIQADYVIKCIAMIRSGKAKILKPRLDISLRLKDEMTKGMTGTVWKSGCDSWYLDVNGNPILYPFSLEQFARDMRAPQWEEFELC